MSDFEKEFIEALNDTLNSKEFHRQLVIEERDKQNRLADEFLQKCKLVTEMVRNNGNAIAIGSAERMEDMEIFYYGADPDIVYLLTEAICTVADNMAKSNPPFAWACLKASIGMLTDKCNETFGR